MNESKIELTHRLQREGRWSEASLFKDQTIKQLRGEGKTRSEAQEAAWEALEEKFPPLATQGESLAEEAFSEQFEDVPASTPEGYFRDATWVYERLSVSGVKPTDSPSPGAWSMLQWAKQNQDRFFEQIMPKVFTAKQKAVESSKGSEWDACDDMSELMELLADARKRVDEAIKGNVPEHVRSGVRRRIDDLNLRLDVVLPGEYCQQMTAIMVQLIDEVVQVAIKNPELFQRNAE